MTSYIKLCVALLCFLGISMYDIIFHYSCSYSNAAFMKLKKEAHRSWKMQDQPKPSTLSFAPSFPQSLTMKRVFNQEATPKSTKIPSSSPKEFDVTFVSQGT